MVLFLKLITVAVAYEDHNTKKKEVRRVLQIHSHALMRGSAGGTHAHTAHMHTYARTHTHAGDDAVPGRACGAPLPQPPPLPVLRLLLGQPDGWAVRGVRAVRAIHRAQGGGWGRPGTSVGASVPWCCAQLQGFSHLQQPPSI